MNKNEVAYRLTGLYVEKVGVKLRNRQNLIEIYNTFFRGICTQEDKEDVQDEM